MHAYRFSIAFRGVKVQINKNLSFVLSLKMAPIGTEPNITEQACNQRYWVRFL